MSKSTRYFIQPGSNFTDFSLDYAPEATLAGHTITVKGTSNVDYLFVSGAFHLDFSESLSGQDVVFVRGSRGAFTPSVVDGTLVLRIGIATSLRLSEDDVVVFDDGKTVVKDWMTALNANTPAPALDASLTSMGTANDLSQRVMPGVTPNALVRAFGGGDEGNTFAQVQSGMTMSVKGTTAVDVVYVKAGTVVDFSESLGGVDKLYLTGSFTDYRFTLDNASLKLVRGDTESVLASTDDRLIFADGTVLVQDIVNLLPNQPSPTPDNLAAKWSTNERTPGLAPPLDLDTGPNAADNDYRSPVIVGRERGASISGGSYYALPSVSVSGDITFAAWVRPEFSTSAEGCLIEVGNANSASNLMLRIAIDGRLKFQPKSAAGANLEASEAGSVTSTNVLPNVTVTSGAGGQVSSGGAWIHVAVTVDSARNVKLQRV